MKRWDLKSFGKNNVIHMRSIIESIYSGNAEALKDMGFDIYKVAGRKGMNARMLKNTVLKLNELVYKISSGEFDILDNVAFDVSSLNDVERNELVEVILQFLHDGDHRYMTCFEGARDFVVVTYTSFLNTLKRNIG